MNIVFICGGMEPGKDGVGDYTRKLAAELIQQGHESFLISMCDKYVKKHREEQQKQEGINIRVLRMGTCEKEQYRFQIASKAIKMFNPDWISLQYVPYSFSYKGIPWDFSRRLRQLGANWKWHIMFHELWVETGGAGSIKLRLTGFFQKLIIERMLNHLSPVVISTSLRLYQERLKNYEVNLLPLFGNISAISGVTFKREDFVTAIHFGGFTAKLKEFEDQLTWLKRYGGFKGKSVHLIVIGGGGPFKRSALTCATNILGMTSVRDLGRLDSNEISVELLKADIGISRADQQYFGKSGSTISMLEHGLPVLLRGERNNFDFFESKADKNLLFITDDPGKEYKRIATYSNLQTTANRFLNDLQSRTVSGTPQMLT